MCACMPVYKTANIFIFSEVGWVLSRPVRFDTLKGDSWAFFLRDVLILLGIEVVSLDEWEQ